MSDAVMSLATVLQRDLQSINATANNAANTLTQGYKAERIYSRFDLGNEPTQSANAQHALDLHNGVTAVTQRGLDFAIVGEGWFTVRTPQGVHYTRDGHFQAAADGVLKTSAGYPVLGDDGDIALGDNLQLTDSSGRLRSADGRETQLHLVALKSPRASGSGLYIGEEMSIDGKARVLQGALERSNVDVGQEMIRMMETTRHFESVQRAMSAYDQMLNVGINELGK